MRRTRFARTGRAWLVAGALGIHAVAAAQTAATPHVAVLHADPAGYYQPSNPAARAEAAQASYRA